MNDAVRDQINAAWDARVAQTGAAFRAYFLGCDREEAILRQETAPECARRDEALASIKGDRVRRENEIWAAHLVAMRPHQAAMQARLSPLRTTRAHATQAAWDEFEAARALALRGPEAPPLP